MQEHTPTRPTPATARLSLALPAAGEGLSRIRRTVHHWLAAQGVTEEADGAVLLVNELITNAQQHAPGPARLRLFLHNGRLRCEVADGHRIPPLLIRPGTHDEGGRGLQLVAALASRWGSLPAGRGKIVWFELKVTPMP